MNLLKKSSVSASIQVIGSGEAFDSGLGNSSYLFQGQKLPTVLFDCGYQIPERLWSKGLHTQIDAICFTHLHADHSFGIVPLLVRYWEEGRTNPLTVFGPRGTESFVNKLLNMGYPGIARRFQFPIIFKSLDPKRPLNWNGLCFSAARTIHSVLNYTVRIDLKSGRSFSVSGDGQITRATKALVSDVDLHFQEVYSLKSEVPVHADLETVLEWAGHSEIKTLVLSHFSRASKTKIHQKLRAKVQKSLPRVIASKPWAQYLLK